ncbi:Fic family protein [Methylomonas sp. LWB]|uniref:Fic family protein n=1 Tax=Methylomonas sp. LWB TaxID=1905845 RepID=UPI0034A478F5
MKTSFRERYLKPTLALGRIEMTVPDKPNSRSQPYRLTDSSWTFAATKLRQ